MPIPAIDTEHARQMFRVRAEVFEGKDLSTDGLVYQELARALLVRGVYEPLRFVIGYLPYLVPKIDLSNKGDYDAITQAYLTRLADHDFSSYWPEGIREALAPIVAPIAQPDDHPPAAVSVPPRIVAGPTLKEAFDAWVANRGRTGRDKTTDEFRLAIARFEEICGTSDVTLITTEMVETFAATVAKMPARAKRDVATLPILEQIARAERDKLPTLQAPTVGEAADAGLIPIRADMADLDDIRTVAARIAYNGAVLDVLVANAGTAETTVFGEIDPATFDRTFDLNVRGVFFAVQSLLPHLSYGAWVVLIGSIVSIKGMADLSVYNASKAAVRSFARSWANDLKARRIRVNTISPGPVRTPLAHQLQGEADGSIAAFEEWTAQNAPAGRIGEPDDIASAVRFLAGAGANYINGIELFVDGGLAQI